MQYNLILALAASVGLVSAALPKANEYKSLDCSGDLNFGHNAFDLHMVTMDDSTHSVYQAGTAWYLFDGKASDGGRCTGNFLGQVNADTPACLLVDRTSTGQRIRCLCNPLIGIGAGGKNSCDYVS
ncbi:small secreted protein [Penicillium frequentans]|uniref:Small secreted protein n=1 Tax=Penicillium frequentans TaxID=3151616 RepID=A0AAD6CWV6_9EURO|nr:small secreted protein [Penicillium glabrum]KAJ5540911.1 small secreted protein [Penicillium glabrum]